MGGKVTGRRRPPGLVESGPDRAPFESQCLTRIAQATKGAEWASCSNTAPLPAPPTRRVWGHRRRGPFTRREQSKNKASILTLTDMFSNGASNMHWIRGNPCTNASKSNTTYVKIIVVLLKRAGEAAALLPIPPPSGGFIVKTTCRFLLISLWNHPYNSSLESSINPSL